MFSLADIYNLLYPFRYRLIILSFIVYNFVDVNYYKIPQRFDGICKKGFVTVVTMKIKVV